MPVTIQIHFKGVGSKIDAPKNKPVDWKISSGISVDAVMEGTTNTNGDGLLIIPGIEAVGNLRLIYTIGTQSGMIPFKIGEDAKGGETITISHYLSLRLELTIQDQSNKEPIKNVPIHWSATKGSPSTTIQVPTTSNTTNLGKFTWDFEIGEVETGQFKFKVEGQQGKVDTTLALKHDGATKNGNPLVVTRAVRLETPIVSEPKPEIIEDSEAPEHQGYDIRENNAKYWDWLTWETEGNSDLRYQRGGKTRKLGLYRLNYDLLRKAGGGEWKKSEDERLLGGGWVKVAVLDAFDYSNHLELIRTFLPCFRIEKGKVFEPFERIDPVIELLISKSEKSEIKVNTSDVPPPIIVMPFNFDDNGPKSNAIGKELESGVFPIVKTKKLELELNRWSSASRSTIAAFPMPEWGFWKPAPNNKWNLRPEAAENPKFPFFPNEWTTQIVGPPGGQMLCQFQKEALNKKTRYYSVKTGVQFVSTVDQSGNKKDQLEENSIHAMNRSNLIAATINRLGMGRFKARYQLEVLCILILRDPATSQKVAENPDGLENKETEKPKYQRRDEIAVELKKIIQNRKPMWELVKKEEKIELDKLNNDVSLADSKLSEWQERKEKKVEPEKDLLFMEEGKELEKALVKAKKELVDGESIIKAESKQKWFKIQTETDVGNQIKLWNLIMEIAVNDLAKSITRLSTTADKIKPKDSVGSAPELDNEPLMVIDDKEGTFKVVCGGKKFEKFGKSESVNCIKIASFVESVDFDSFSRQIEPIINQLSADNKTAVSLRKQEIEEDKLKLGFDGIQIREVSDAAIEDIWFPALAIPSHGKAFFESWAKESEEKDWVKFWETNYAVPMGEAKGEMLLHFGMQHMTSNAQNFLVAFDRGGGKGGKLKHLILRDIGDTLYNDYLFEVLNEVDPLFKKEFTHESKDKFGVTLASELGSYTKPRMIRIGASIVFLFGPFVQGEILKRKDCYKLLARWCMAHNYAFLNYLRGAIGYTNDWNPGKDEIKPEFRDSLSKSCELNKKNDSDYESIIVPGVLNLHSTSRWKLIEEFELECKNIPDKNTIDKVDEEIAAQTMRLVNAHEVLICAEAQCFIRSEKGKAALRKLHLGEEISVVSTPSKPSNPLLTLDNFYKLRRNMSYQQAVQIIGFEGTETTEQSDLKYKITSFEWRNEGYKSIYLNFQDDKLFSKGQANLR